MKKYLLLPLFATLAFSQEPISVQDPFKQIDKIFQMQMKQMQLMQKQMDEMFKAFEKNDNFNMHIISSSNSIISSPLQDKKDYYELIINTDNSGKTELNVDAKEGLLNISIKQTKNIEKNTSNGVVKSISTNSYIQSFTLPKDADSKNIKYENKDGKIIIKIPKKK
jgi:HSP20 family molecular chaperone IbpA